MERVAKQFWKVANRTVQTEIVSLLFTSVQVLFFVLNTFQQYELRSIKPKGGFYTHVVFNSTYQVLTKFHKDFLKKFVFLSVQRNWKTINTFRKKTTVINVFILNKLDFQNCFLLFLSLKPCMNAKSFSESGAFFMSSSTISSKSSSLLDTKRFCLVSSAWAFCRDSIRMHVLHQSYLAIFLSRQKVNLLRN